MGSIKRFFKRNSHNVVNKALAGFGRSLNRFYENRNHDIYSNGEITILKKISKTNPKIIVDGGANIGKYSLVTLEYIPHCRIYALEPVESTFQELQKNTEGHNSIITICKGLYSKNCTQEINIFNSNTHSSLYDIRGGAVYDVKEKFNIELMRGDDFMEDMNIDFIDLLKLDLEGAEYDALVGFEQALAQKKIRAIQFEYGYINISTRKLLIDFYELCERHGYIIGKIFPKKVEFREYEYKYEDFIGPNFMAVRIDDTELIELLS